MKKIVGYKLKNVPVETIDMPLGADILTAMDVNGEPTVFAIIDVDELATAPRTIYRVVTGKPVDPDIFQKGYLGSFLIANYGIVYHFFTGGDVSINATFDITKIVAAKEGPPEHPFEM